MQIRMLTKSVALALSLCFTGAVLAANVQTFELQTPAGPYHVEIRERSEGDERLLVQKNKKNLLDQVDHNFALIDPTSKEPNLGYTGSNLPLFDFDGNGTKDLIVRIWNGGAHCCYTYDIYSLANRASKIWHFSAGDGHMLTMPANSGGLPIILIEDSTFRYWGAGVDVMPVVALRWQPDKIKIGAFKVDMGRMRSGEDKHRLPSEDEVKRSLKKNFTSVLSDYMLNLYYTGHGKDANKFLETVWPGSANIEKMGTASAFKHDFMKQLTTSPFFDAIESLNHGQVDFQEVK